MKRAAKKINKVKDSDGDGLSDFDEINIFGSDPYNSDSNSDGIEDGEAILDGKDPVTGDKLREFFLPSEKNNYCPGALKAKRVFLHATAIIAVKAIVVAFVLSYPVLAWMTPDIAAAEGKKIIALTNDLRSSLSLPTLKENLKLDRAAAEKVDDMFISSYFAHVSPQGQGFEHFLSLVGYGNYATAGENLAMGYENAEEAMAAWKDSPTHYANLTDSNYSEIGVAMAGGNYAARDTVFIAQYFGLPNEPAVAVKKPETATLATTQAQKAAPTLIITKEEAKITTSIPAGGNNEKVIKVEVKLPPETDQAVAQIAGQEITLAPVPIEVEVASSSTSVEDMLIATSAIALVGDADVTWTGQKVLTEEKNSPASIAPPVVLATDKAGNTAKVSVSPDSVEVQKASPLGQYKLMKDYQDKGLGKIFAVSSIYFKFMLGFAMLILCLNIFVQIKKQNIKAILSGVGIVGLLVLAIVF